MRARAPRAVSSTLLVAEDPRSAKPTRSAREDASADDCDALVAPFRDDPSIMLLSAHNSVRANSLDRSWSVDESKLERDCDRGLARPRQWSRIGTGRDTR